MLHDRPIRPPANLAAALRPHEPDPVADLLPVDRVEPAQLRLDGPGRMPAQASGAAGHRGSRSRGRVDAATARRLDTAAKVVAGFFSVALATARPLGWRAGDGPPSLPRVRAACRPASVRSRMTR